MVSGYVRLFLECWLAMMVSSSVVKRSYETYPLEICPQNAVCSDIYSLTSQGFGPTTFLVQHKCKCPANTKCPSMPGEQTLATDADKWYGLCQPSEDIPRCQRGEIAEQLFIDSSELNGQSYVKVLCKCHESELQEGSAPSIWTDTTADSRSAKYVQNLVCSGDSVMTKRGRYGGDRSRGRFYFYKR